ncbi:hypothetical protein FHR81_005220 [Actinoalloteichus hoggarensis]|uniref:hypothetical protein n=1 Tax=Actinoalloteichus hoggarensis TaxID=1470176 RepID=UPI000B8AEC40|nr:hypothetical protein [Actinoalloteichus hoggarensis]MBB5924143.1 hypothetical protein [Actinoalloteichus hoggarensis]
MNARTGSIAGGSSGEPARPAARRAPRDGGSSSTTLPDDDSRLWIAIAVAGGGALLATLAPLTGLTTPASAPGFASWPLTALIHLLPATLAALFAVRGRPGVAVGLLIASALVAPGRALADGVLLVDAASAVRPELIRLATLEPTGPGLGAVLLVVAHLAALSAGVIAYVGSRVDAGPSHGIAFGAVPGPGLDTGSSAASADSDDVERLSGIPDRAAPVQAGRRQGTAITALFVIVAACLGLAGAPFSSEDPYLLSKAVLDADGLVLGGWVAAFLGLVVSTLLATAARDTDGDRALGGLLGTALLVFALAAPSVAAGLFAAELKTTAGPVFALVAAFVLALLALRITPRPSSRTTAEGVDEVRLPGARRLRRAAGVPALLAGLALAGGAVLPGLAPTDRLTAAPVNHQAGLLVPAAVLLILFGVGLLVSVSSTVARPALVVGWLAAPMVAAVSLDVVFAANQLVGAGLGAGAWLVMAAVPLAGAGGFLAWTAGAVEREDVDLSEWPADLPSVIPAAMVALWALGAFALPVLESEELRPAGILSNFQIASWSQVLGLLGVVVAVALAPRSRPAQAAGLFLGAAALLLLRVLEYPLTSDRVADAAPGPGLWLGLCGVAVSAVGAGVVFRATRRSADPTPRD